MCLSLEHPPPSGPIPGSGARSSPGSRKLPSLSGPHRVVPGKFISSGVPFILFVTLPLFPITQHIHIPPFSERTRLPGARIPSGRALACPLPSAGPTEAALLPPFSPSVRCRQLPPSPLLMTLSQLSQDLLEAKPRDAPEPPRPRTLRRLHPPPQGLVRAGGRRPPAHTGSVSTFYLRHPT